MAGYKINKGGTSAANLNPFNNKEAEPQTSGKRRKTFCDEYKGMASKREPFLTSARRYSKMTLPQLFNDSDIPATPQGEGYNQNGWQSLGAAGVNHLGNKLVLTWFPPQRPFFKMSFTDRAKQALYSRGIQDKNLAALLSNGENRAMDWHNQHSGRIAWTQAAKHLQVAGNAMLYVPEDGNVVCYPLDRYVIKRAKDGLVLKGILEEMKSFSELPKEVQDAVKLKRPTIKPDVDVAVYTKFQWNAGRYHIRQEVEGLLVGDDKSVKAADCPFIPLVWDRLYGEDYGRGLVEIHAGDIYCYGFLAEAVAKGAALMSQVKFLVKRGSATSPTQHAKSKSGDYVWGEEGDIHVVQLNKYADLQSVNEVMGIYERRIGNAFLMQSAVRRQAERVTAEEIRQDAQELETALGGTYTHIANSGQQPYSMLLLKRSGFHLDAKDVVPTVVTGLDALGKSSDLDKIAQFSQMMQIPNGWAPEAREWIKWDAYMSLCASNLNMEANFLMSETEHQKMVQQRQEQAQQQAMMDAAGKAAPQLMKGASQ